MGSVTGVLALLLLQAVAGPPLPPELRKRAPRPSLPCLAETGGDEIVVCGRPTDQRLERMPEPSHGRPLSDLTTFRIPGGGTGNVHAVQNTLPNGAISQGAAVTLRLPFGRRRKVAEDVH